MHIKKRSFMIITALLLSVTLLASPMGKTVNAASYSFYDLGTWAVVGPGYKTSGGFVGAVQANLWSANLGGTVGSVDGYYGTATSNGIKAYQRMEGLAVDGYVGKQMWSEMEDHTIIHDSRTRKFVHNSSTYATHFYYYANGVGTSYTGSLVYRSTGKEKVSTGTMWSTNTW